MDNNARCIVAACNKLDLKYEILDPEGNLLRVYYSDQWNYFQKNRTPLNVESVYGICKDKGHTYHILKDTVRMPKTLSFLDWNTDKKYKKYVKHNSLEKIVERVEKEFSYPVVAKMNSGALAKNVFYCKDRGSLIQSIETVFSHQSRSYDYIVLVQEYIKRHKEYRLVCFDQKPLLLYERFSDNTTFNTRYWEKKNGRLINISDSAVLDMLMEFVLPVFKVFPVLFVGFDIMIQPDNNIWLIELNSSPRFDNYINTFGDKKIISLYLHIFSSISGNNRM